MMALVLKVGRWVAFVVGCGLFAVGYYLSNEGLITAGAAMAGWATPFVLDIKLAKAAHRLIDLISSPMASPEAKFIANTDAATKLAKVSKHKPKQDG